MARRAIPFFMLSKAVTHVTEISQRIPARKKKLWRRIIENKAAYLMLLPVLVGFAILTIYPNLWVISLSFFKYDGVTNAVFVGMDNYVRLFTRDPGWWRSVGNTFIFSIFKLLVEMPLALLLASLLNRNLKGSNVYRGIIFLPNVTSTAVMSAVFALLFASYNGFYNNVLIGNRLVMRPIEWLNSMPAAMIVCILVSTWQSIGINTIFFLAGLQGISEDVYESADIDGAIGVKRFIHITLPLLARMFQIILMLAIIGSMQTFDLMKVLTNGGPSGSTEVMMTTIYSYFFPASYAASTIPQVGYGSALGVIATAIIGVVTALYLLLSRKMNDVT